MKQYQIFIILFFCASCKSPQFIPIETTKIEYRNHQTRDSILRYDSIFVKEKNDTFIMEKYRYIYRNTIIQDSIFLNDTIRVPYPIEVVKEVKRALSGWENFQLWCGRFALIIVVVALIILIIKICS